MRAAFRRQGQPAWRRHQHEPRILIAGIVQRIEPAGDEGVVERADRQEPRAEQRLGQSERRQQQEQIVFGDAELDMPPRRPQHPFLRRGQMPLAEHIRPLDRGNTPT